MCISNGKWNVLLVHTKPNRDITDLNINFNEKKTEKVSTVNYLDIQINANLPWKDQTEFVCRKVSPK